MIDDFSDARAAGSVVGSRTPDGTQRLGADAERRLAIDNGALRMQPLLRPGWGRQAISYGPFDRRPGLAMAALVLNGHNGSQVARRDDTFPRRLARWVVGSGADPGFGRPFAYARWPHKRGELRKLRSWWALQQPHPPLLHNLAVGWFDGPAPGDMRWAGHVFAVRPEGNENAGLDLTTGGRPVGVLDGLRNVPILYVVVLREDGAVYYASAIAGTAGLPAYPLMRPLGIDQRQSPQRLYAGVQQSVLGENGFRADTRVRFVAVDQVDVAPAISPREPDELIDAGSPIGVLSATVTGDATLIWRADTPAEALALDIGAAACRLTQGVQLLATASLPASSGPRRIQVTDDGALIRVTTEGHAVLKASAPPLTGTGVGYRGAVTGLEGHHRQVAVPQALHVEAPWEPPPTTGTYREDFTGTGDLEQRPGWQRDLGAGRILRAGGGVAVVDASVPAPNPGRTLYTVAWDDPGLAQLAVDVRPPGTQRGQRERCRAGVVLWQDPRNYLIVNIWLDDSYAGGAVSAFPHLDGFEDVYDAVWANVGSSLVHGVWSQLLVTCDGLRLTAWLDGAAVLHRALTDVYPAARPLRLNRVGLAVNWEWGDDTGSTFRRFVAAGHADAR